MLVFLYALALPVLLKIFPDPRERTAVIAVLVLAVLGLLALVSLDRLKGNTILKIVYRRKLCSGDLNVSCRLTFVVINKYPPYTQIHPIKPWCVARNRTLERDHRRRGSGSRPVAPPGSLHPVRASRARGSRLQFSPRPKRIRGGNFR